jgi:choline dehydrogenase-like flavoprotein
VIAQAYESVGVYWIPDANAGEVLGYCEDAQNTYDGKRHYAASSYKLGENVTIWHDTLVEKVIFQGKKAVGVQVSRYLSCGKLEKVSVTTRIEILVCGGVQGSAKLLLLRHVSVGLIFLNLLIIITVVLGLQRSLRNITFTKYPSFQSERTTQTTHSSILSGNYETGVCHLVICHF